MDTAIDTKLDTHPYRVGRVIYTDLELAFERAMYAQFLGASNAARVEVIDRRTGKVAQRPACGCRRCAIHDDPGGCLVVERLWDQAQKDRAAR